MHGSGLGRHLCLGTRPSGCCFDGSGAGPPPRYWTPLCCRQSRWIRPWELGLRCRVSSTIRRGPAFQETAEPTVDSTSAATGSMPDVIDLEVSDCSEASPRLRLEKESGASRPQATRLLWSRVEPIPRPSSAGSELQPPDGNIYLWPCRPLQAPHSGFSQVWRALVLGSTPLLLGASQLAGWSPRCKHPSGAMVHGGSTTFSSGTNRSDHGAVQLPAAADLCPA